MTSHSKIAQSESV